jgi:hypothetical protein
VARSGYVTTPAKNVIDLHCVEYVRHDVLVYPGRTSARGLVWGILLEAVSRLSARPLAAWLPHWKAFDSAETQTTFHGKAAPPRRNRRFTQMKGGAATAAAHQSHWRLLAAYQPRPLAAWLPHRIAFVTMPDKVVISLHCVKCVRPDVLDYPDHASAHGLVRGILLEAVSRLAAKATGCMAPPLAFDSDETKTKHLRYKAAPPVARRHAPNRPPSPVASQYGTVETATQRHGNLCKFGACYVPNTYKPRASLIA